MMAEGQVGELTRRFFEWEGRGRGTTLYPFSVALEPAFRPFRHYRQPLEVLDDARRETLFSWLARLFKERPVFLEEEPESEPKPAEAGELDHLRLYLPRDFKPPKEAAEGFLGSLCLLEHPLSWEVWGEGGRVRYRVAVAPRDRPALDAALAAHLPGVVLSTDSSCAGAPGSGEPLVFEFALSREFVVPLGVPCEPDPLLPLLSVFSQTAPGESLALQVLFTPARRAWRESILRAVRTPAGEPFFKDAPEVTKLAEEKVRTPLFAVALRLAVRTPSRDRQLELARLAAGVLASLGRDNHLVALGDNPHAPEDFRNRETRRTGMILSLSELASLVRLPGPDVHLSGIERGTRKEKEPPAEALHAGILLGETSYQGRLIQVFLPEAARLRHTHVLGATGTGKSTLLVSMILQDIAAGHGVGVIEPHGDLIDAVLGRMPENRAEDVILFDPADPDYAAGWNILSAHSEPEKEMLASDLVAVFQKLSTSWGDNMTATLANAILAFLDSERGGTLSDLRRFLADPSFRRDFLQTVRDPYVRDFWTTEFPLLSGKPQASLLTRLDTLLRSRLVRGVVAEREKPLDFRRVVDDGRIFLARLSAGAIGEENAALLGSLLVSKLHQVCLLRQDRAEEERRSFFLYLDEFHHVATPSMASLFSGARKYRLGVTVAHQDLYQLRRSVPEVERAVLANAYTRICFALRDEDARALSQGFSSFTADDLGNLGIGEAIVRMGKREQDLGLRTFLMEQKEPEALDARRREIRTRSFSRWGTPRREEEAEASPAKKEPEVRKAPDAIDVSQVPGTSSARRVECKAPPKEASDEPRRPGKGGAEHTYLQELIKCWAEERGFRAMVEEQIPGTRESVDVALYWGDLRIACEVSVMTPLEYEVGNVKKCLAANFGTVAVISLKKGRLAKLEKLLASKLPAEEYARVRLFTPEELLSWLSGQPAEEREGEVCGYKVKVRYKAPGDERSKRVAEILARSMSRLEREE